METSGIVAGGNESNGAEVKNGVKNVVTTSNTMTETEIRKRLAEMTVVKRNGILVPFRRDRIATAIEASFREIKGIAKSEPLPQTIYTTVQNITNDVVAEALERSVAGAALTVEGIQDMVEQSLMSAGHFEEARGYILYREERKALREDSPRNLKLLRRDGTTSVRFNPMKIAAAIEKAFRASQKIEGQSPQSVVDAVNMLTAKVVARCVELSHAAQPLHVELIQDEIERQMMVSGFFTEAKDFIIYRAKRTEMRAFEAQQVAAEPEVKEPVRQLTIEAVGRTFTVLNDTAGIKIGETITITEGEIRRRVQHACLGFEKDCSADEVFESALQQFYQGIKLSEIDTAIILAARSKIEKEPNYTYVTARLLMDCIYRETMGTDVHDKSLAKRHQAYFKEYVSQAIEFGRISPELQKFDLEKLGKAMDLNRDLQFSYLGLQTLYDRYLIHHEDRRLETPQIFWMRVSMGLAMNEGEQKNVRAIEFYEVLSKFLFTSSTPTLFNAGTLHPQLSSCYLTTVMDDLDHIFKCVKDDALLSKWAGGLGNDWTSVRATGSRIKGTNGKSQGVIPFLKVANDTAVAVNQGGKRKGAMCAYLETWHLDIEDFLELRKNTGDERRRTHDMNTANWIPDLFMKRVMENGKWTLFSPSDVPDLHDLYGKKFEERYSQYEKMAEEGKIKLFKQLDALTLWRKMLSMVFETGHPWITFKDPSNLRSPQDHVGVVHSSNLCTEILLNTSPEETAVCNLGSINLVTHVTAQGLNKALLEKTVKVALRMLDNVIDINFYPTIEAKNANLKHRPVGLGIMGFQDALHVMGQSYASPEGVAFADQSMEAISYYAILASSELAKERGAYASYKGSKWDRGMLPLDTIQLVRAERGAQYLDVDESSTMEWDSVRQSVKQYGMRNSNVMAIAPTATISNITGVSQSIEPYYKQLFVKSNLSGDFIVHNEYLVRDLKAEGLWDDEMIDDLKYFDGSLIEIERVPAELRQKYLTAFEIDAEWLIEAASRRQKWIDMGESFNLYIAEPNGKRISDMYQSSWKKGLKTTYYLRSLGATQIEKSTTDLNKRGLQPRWMKNKSASSEVVVNRETSEDAPKVAAAETNPGKAPTKASTGGVAIPKVCGLDGDCESCQ